MYGARTSVDIEPTILLLDWRLRCAQVHIKQTGFCVLLGDEWRHLPIVMSTGSGAALWI